MEAVFKQFIAKNVGSLFRRMELADEVLNELFPRNKRTGRPTQASQIVHAAACPSPPLRDKTDDLYIAHIRELAERVKAHGAKADLELGTDAEVIAALSDASLKAPLNRVGQCIYEYLFTKRLLGTLTPAQREKMPARHDLELYHRDELDGMKRKLSRQRS